MKNLLSFIMVAPFFVFFVFQPFYTEIYSLRQQTIEIVLDSAMEKAAVKGRFDEVELQGMKDTIIKIFHYAPNEVTINATQSLTNRGNYIEASIQIPAGQLWVMPGLFSDNTTDPQTIKAYSKQMSEYLSR
ncbi:MAG: hypothetical protein ACYC4E_00630 [Carboxydocellales bacterium]